MRLPAQLLPTVAPTGAPTPFMNLNVSPDAFGAGIARGEGAIAQGLGQAGDVLEKNAVKFQAIQDEANVNDVNANKFGPQFRDMYQKYYSLQGKDAVDGIAPTTQAMEDLRTQMRDELPNGQQQRMFDQMSRTRVERELDGMSRYADQQNKVYRAQTSDSTLKMYQQDAIDKYNDPQARDLALRSGQDEIDRYAQSAGQSTNTARERMRQYTSDTWAGIVERQATNDPVGALALYRENMNQIDGTKHQQLEKALKSEVQPVTSRATADRIMTGNPTMNTDALVTAVKTAESGNDPNVPVSSKGAVGIMQLMPDTARDMAAKLNIPFDPVKLANDPEYNQQLGTAYLQEMGKRYGGNQTLALAAYNAGPKTVDGWVKQFGDPNSGTISDADFAAKIPWKETRDYVAKINAQVSPTAGVPATSADVRTHLPQWLTQADAVAEAVAPGDAVYKDMLRTHIMAKAGQISSANAQAEKGARDTLMATAMGLQKGADGTTLTEMAPGKKPTSVEELLTTPEAKQAWGTMDSIGQHGILALVAANAKGTSPPMTTEALGKYAELRGMSYLNPDGFLAANLAAPELTTLLPHSLAVDLINLQSAVGSKQARAEAGAERLTHALTLARPILEAAGIRTQITDKSTDTDKKTYERFVGSLDKALTDNIAQTKKQPNDSDIRRMAGTLLTPGHIVGGGKLWGDSSGVPYFQSQGTGFYVDPPATELPKIQADFKAINGRMPTTNETREIYTAFKLKNPG